MTNCTHCIIFCAASINLYKINLFFMPVNFYCPFNYLVSQINILCQVTRYALYKAPSTPLLPVIHTVHIIFILLPCNVITIFIKTN